MSEPVPGPSHPRTRLHRRPYPCTASTSSGGSTPSRAHSPLPTPSSSMLNQTLSSPSLVRPSSSSSSFVLDPSTLRPLSTKGAARIFTNMRRPFSPTPRKRLPDISKSGMYSTPEERTPFAPSRFRPHGLSSPPTVEQISMGLHLSRTPHLRPVSRQRHSPPLSQHSHSSHFPPLVLPPTQPRSSLKNSSTLASAENTTPGLSAASLSTTTSTTPSTPVSTQSLTSLKSRMARLLPGRGRERVRSASAQETAERPRKAVRFSASVLGLTEVASRTHNP